jgi:uncharacterized membrane protein YdjX (TVP38/TMEM64 family)
MNESVAEALILTINALGAGILIFIAGVLQKIMDDMDEHDFKRFLNALVTTAMNNYFLVTVATLPIIAAIMYFLAYGFHHWWITMGFIVWFIGSSITKIINMPVYKWVGDQKNNDPEDLRKQRRKLRLGNNLRAWFTFASVVLMACQLGVGEIVVVVVLSGIIAFPLVKWARKYIPG